MTINSVGEVPKAGHPDGHIQARCEDARGIMKDVKAQFDKTITLSIAALTFVGIKHLDQEFRAFAKEHFGIADEGGTIDVAPVPVEDDMPF